MELIQKKYVLILHSSFVNRHFPGFQPDNSDASGPPVKSDGDGLTLDNDRNLAKAVGVLQHRLEIPGIFDNIQIIKLKPLLGKCFTSCPGVGSSILSKN
jgi:hypothetical protein